MNKIITYLRYDAGNTIPVDQGNADGEENAVIPAIMRGTKSNLCLRILEPDGAAAEWLTPFTKWEFVLANDWLPGTPPELLVPTGITVEGNEIQIPIGNTNTESIVAALGNSAEIEIGAELAGFETGETLPGVVFQFTVKIRNRRYSAEII